MAKSAANREPRLVHDSSELACVLSLAQVRYLQTVRKLLIEHQRTSGVQQKHIFVMMIHAFMQELCGYPATSYIVTNAVYSNTAAENNPHVVPASHAANLTLFYFTTAEDPDDVHDLWVKQAQVYLVTPGKEDFTAEHATHMVFTNFFVIDGARKDPNMGAWNLWSVSDIQAAQVARVDLRHLENTTELAATTSHVILERLQTLQYQLSTPKQHSSWPGR